MGLLSNLPSFLRTLLIEANCFFVSMETTVIVIRVFVFGVQEVDLVVAEEGGEIGLLVCVVEEISSGSGAARVISLFGFELPGTSEGPETSQFGCQFDICGGKGGGSLEYDLLLIDEPSCKRANHGARDDTTPVYGLCRSRHFFATLCYNS